METETDGRQRITCPYCGTRVLVCKDGSPRSHTLDGRQRGQLCDGVYLRVNPDGQLVRGPNMPAWARMPEVTCTGCGRQVRLRRDSRLRGHTPTGDRTQPWCPGSRMPPGQLATVSM